MAKKSRKQTSVEEKTSSQPSLVARLQQYESEISSFLGIAVVVMIIGVVLYLLRGTLPRPSVTDQAANTQTETTQATPLPNQYVVKAGQGLWHIAQEVYGDGYKWMEIARANNLSAPYAVNEGQTLTIPELTDGSPAPTAEVVTPATTQPTPMAATLTPEASPAVTPAGTISRVETPTPAPAQEGATPATAGEYVVKEGDYLWKIAMEQYGGNGYAWVEIYRANRQVIGNNPGLIYPGQRLTLPILK